MEIITRYRFLANTSRNYFQYREVTELVVETLPQRTTVKRKANESSEMVDNISSKN